MFSPGPVGAVSQPHRIGKKDAKPDNFLKLDTSGNINAILKKYLSLIML